MLHAEIKCNLETSSAATVESLLD